MKGKRGTGECAKRQSRHCNYPSREKSWTSPGLKPLAHAGSDAYTQGRLFAWGLGGKCVGEELLCEVIPPNLSRVGVHCCLSGNPFQRAYMGSRGTPHGRPASCPAPVTEQLLRKKVGQDSGMAGAAVCWPWGVFLPGHRQGEEPQLPRS